MCGFWISTNGTGLANSLFLSHRGPDACKFFDENNLHGVHSRLSIFDLSTNSDQPFNSPDGRYTLFFNGSIVNFKDLKREMAANGSVFVTNSDTETLLMGFSIEGFDFLKKVRGMFSFVLIDRLKRKIFGARDFFGIKPFYLTQLEGGILFSSEVPSRAGIPNLKLSTPGFFDYMNFGYSLGSSTIVSGCVKVPRNSKFSIDLDSRKLKIEDVQFSDLLSDKRSAISESIDSKELKCIITKSIIDHATSDVPIGVSLSSGIDSNIIAGILGKSRIDCKTFTVDFKNKGMEEIGESDLAKRAAAYYRIPHITVKASIGDCMSSFTDICCKADEPIADAAVIGSYLVSQCARANGVRVLLQGDGGDELFGGYVKYRRIHYVGLLSSFWSIGLKTRKLFRPHSKLFNKFRTIEYLSMDKIALKLAYMNANEAKDFGLATFVRKELIAEQRELFEEKMKHWYASNANAGQESSLGELAMKFDQEFLLHDNYLRKVDRGSMLNGVEARVPYLDFLIREAASALPISQKFDLLRGKKFLRSQFNQYIFPELRNRKKYGFFVPFGNWLRRELRQELIDMIEANADIFSRSTIDLVHQHSKGEINASYLLWKLYAFCKWRESVCLKF